MRQERGWSQQEAHEHLHEGLGLAPKSRASYVTLEAGRTPDPAQQKFLVSYFGKTPDDEPEPSAETSLAAALSELAAELRESRLAREATEARLRAVEAELLSLRGLPVGAGSLERSALPG